jgi:hypothetical protein
MEYLYNGKNGVLRIFEPKRKEVVGGWIRLQNELRNFTLH